MSNATMLWLHLNEWSTRRIPGVFDIDDSFAAFGEAIAASRQTPLDSDGGIDALDQPSKLLRPGKGESGQKFESLVFRAMRKAANGHR